VEERNNASGVPELEVSKLDIKDGDILLIRIPAGKVPDKEAQMYFSALRDRLTTLGFKDVTVLILDAEIDIETLDERIMSKYGWVKAPKAESMLH
jgi:hypothetical protein